MQASGYDFTEDLVCWATLYANADMPVLPVHSPRKQPRARCDCPRGDACKNPAKHPRTEHGLRSASTDEADIKRWWSMWPRANVGVLVPPGYVVVDLDGLDGLEALGERGWKLPETVTAATARGWHHWYLSEVEFRPGSDFLPHVDLRGRGSYVIAPPSLHYTGVQYEWERSPIERQFARAPAWIAEMVKLARERRSREPAPSANGPIIEGARNDTLTRIAGAMRRYGCSENAILAALEVTNSERCVPPMDDAELRVIASSVARYAPEQLEAQAGDWAPAGWRVPDW